MKRRLVSLVKNILLFIGSLNGERNKSRMVYYHDVHSSEKFTDMSTYIHDFDKHIKLIRSYGFKIVREFSGAANEIRIGFDDGFRGIWENRDYFVRNSVPATIFIATSLIGKPGYLSNEEIIELESLGFNIQSHGVRHTDLTSLEQKDLTDDLTISKQYLENLLDKTIDEICFPIGYFNNQIIIEAMKAGYERMFSSMPEPVGFPKQLKGRLLFQGLNDSQVKLALRGGFKILQNHYQKLHYRTV